MDGSHRSKRFCVLLALTLLSTFVQLTTAQVTIYGQIPLAQLRAQQRQTDDPVAIAFEPTSSAYDRTRLIPPALPAPMPATTFTIELPREATTAQQLSIPHTGGAFYGFSIEMSVLNQVVGRNSTHLYVPFLNLMANIVERAGSMYMRWGGNTQEYAMLVPELDHHRTFGKQASGSLQTTDTPAVLYTIDMFYMAANISNLMNTKFFFGIPFNVTDPWRLDIAELSQQILGDALLGLQAGNEPDLYGPHHKRPQGYTEWDYFGEVGQLIETIDANPRIPVKNNLIGPSVASTEWGPDQVWATGYMEVYRDRMFAFCVERYPHHNCAAAFNTGQAVVDPQTVFPTYLNHQSVVDFVAQYTSSANRAVGHNKPFMMFETNTASCGGFPGISRSFGSAMWATDYGLQMAFNNFSNALLHVGGQSVYYNPFTAPPTNQSTFNQWTVGPVYYSTLILAEVFGKSERGRVVDLRANGASPYTPAYAVYEGNELNKVALFNFMDDVNAPGTADITVQIRVPTGGPQEVYVKYLASDSVSSYNLTWAGQTFGGDFESDGRLKGELNVRTIACGETCNILVPAPGFALVFFNKQDQAVSLGQASMTYATSAYTRDRHTATYDPFVLATSNGQSEKIRYRMGATSPGSVVGGAGHRSGVIPVALAVVAVGLTAWAALAQTL